jgi:hypothetical protein
VKYLADLFSRIDAQQYLRIAVLAIFCLTFANVLFSVMSDEFGLGYHSFLHGSDDRYADLVKTALSFKTLTHGLENQPSFAAWPDLFKNYYFHNPYAGREGLASGELTHFHEPPLYALQHLLCSLIIVKTGSPQSVLWLFFAIYLFGVYWLIYHSVRQQERTWTVQVTIWFVCLLGYPALLLFTRGNYNAGFTGLVITYALISLFGYKDGGVAAWLPLAVAVNIRPNSLIFLLAFPITLGIRRSLKPCIRFFAMALGVVCASYLSVHWIYPDYTISAFRKGLEIYNRRYMLGPGGDQFNSSLLALVKGLRAASLALVNGYPMDFMLNFQERISGAIIGTNVTLVFGALAIIVALVAFWGLWRSSCRRLIAPFVLTALYCLLTPVFADYHLLVFLAPLLLLSFHVEDWTGHYRAVSAIALASIFVLSPKNYTFLNNGCSLQTILNPLILYLAILYLATLRENGHREPHLAQEAPDGWSRSTLRDA